MSREAPYSVEAEQNVLGSIFLDNRCLDEVCEVIAEADFYRADHQIMFRGFLALSQGRKPIDLTTAVEYFRQLGQLEEVGGMAYILTLANDTPSYANVMAYAEIVRDRSTLRRLIAAGSEIAELGYRPDGRDAAEIVDAAQRAVMAIGERRESSGPEDIGSILAAEYDAMDARRVSGDVGMQTGLIGLDNATGGMQPGDVWVIAGRPSMGKTALAINIADFVSGSELVQVFSMEMSKAQLGRRILSANARVPGNFLMDPRTMPKDCEDRLPRVIAELRNRSLRIDDRGGLSVMQVRAKARKLTRHKKLGLIVVDYIQLMSGVGGNRNEEVNEITRGLKSLAKEIGCCVIALSQLNRGCESRDNKRPKLSDLRESGGIEQDADVVIGMYRDEYYHPDSPHKGIAEAIILKQRNGATGTVELSWDGPICLFSDYTGPSAKDREPQREMAPKKARGFGRQEPTQGWQRDAA